MATKSNVLDFQKLEKQANEYAKEVFAKTNFKIGGSMEEQAPLIIAALVQAWAEGYFAAKGKK